MKVKGFTLVELLVVIAIIALLLSILMPALGNVRENARVVVCKSNLKSINVAATLFSQANNDHIVPQSFAWGDPIVSYAADGTPYIQAGDSSNPGSLQPYLASSRDQMHSDVFVCPSASRVKFFNNGDNGSVDPQKEKKCTYGVNYYAACYTAGADGQPISAGHEGGTEGPPPLTQYGPVVGNGGIYWNKFGKCTLSGIYYPASTIYFIDHEYEAVGAWNFDPINGPFRLPMICRYGWHGKAKNTWTTRSATAWYGSSNIAFFDGHVDKESSDFLKIGANNVGNWERCFYKH